MLRFKLLSSVFLLTIFFAKINAQEANPDENVGELTKFYVLFVDTSRIDFSIDQEPRIINNVETLNVVCDDFSVEYLWSEIDKFGFCADMSNLESVEEIIGEIFLNNNFVYFKNFKPGEEGYTYAIDGSTILNFEIDDDGSSVVDLRGYSNSVYIFRIGGKTFKVLKTK